MTEHTYPEPDNEEGFLYVREWEDERLMQELRFLLPLFHAVTSEVAFRADHPEYSDGTGDIRASFTALYRLSDDVERYAKDFVPDQRRIQPDENRES